LAEGEILVGESGGLEFGFVYALQGLKWSAGYHKHKVLVLKGELDNGAGWELVATGQGGKRLGLKGERQEEQEECWEEFHGAKNGHINRKEGLMGRMGPVIYGIEG
jgi:hypothetical protein